MDERGERGRMLEGLSESMSDRIATDCELTVKEWVEAGRSRHGRT
jgi:hypothetical protein